MKAIHTLARCVGASMLLLAAGVPPRAAADERAGLELFESKIRPVLVERCFGCHSASAKELKGGLRLDSRAGWQSGGDTGPAIIPGDPDNSPVVQALRYDTYEMPPDGKLSEAVIGDFVEWIALGAPSPPDLDVPTAKAAIDWEAGRRFWSFQPIVDPQVPQVARAEWPRVPLDYFVLARLEAERLQPVEPADKRALIRRATFDLVGLPPTPEEIEQFLADDSPEAFARVVDRLLDSPHYGERWARHWLDVARYAEDQAHSFRPRLYPLGYRYRDWLVRALNDDMPYDRFVKEQIAADLLDEPDRSEHLPALGFFAIGPVYYGDRQMFDQYDDRLDTLTRGFLGLTVACARCHDHKYDPIPTADYYSLAGVIASSEYVEVPLAPPDVVQAWDEAKRRVDAAEGEVAAFLKAQAAELKVAEKDVENKLPDEAKQQLAALRQSAEGLKDALPPKYPTAHAIRDRQSASNLKINIRGDPSHQGDEVPRRFLRILAGDQAPAFTHGSGRLELAQAIASRDNPLTARVAVNRLWQHLFGRGLVASASNFGALGEPPTHPELLDHLASRLVAEGWSIKKLTREIMLSSTYQLSSRDEASCLAADPDNRLLWRQNRRRLEVEPWRDAMLAVAGTLDRSLGGPSVDLAADGNRRRTLYAKISRHQLDGLLRLFDFPDPNITAGERTVTTVPLQQLYVLNSPFVLEQSRALAARIAAARDGQEERIEHAYLLAFGRPPTARELAAALEFVEDETATAAGSPWQQFAQVLLSANEFMYLD